MTTEEELLKRLEDLDFEKQNTQKALTRAKQVVIDTETHLIGLKIEFDKVKEELRRFRNANPKYESNHRDREIKRFRETYPDLCEEAAQRDRDRE